MLIYNIALVTNGSPVSYCGVSTSPLIFPSEISPDFAPPIDTVVTGQSSPSRAGRESRVQHTRSRTHATAEARAVLARDGARVRARRLVGRS